MSKVPCIAVEFARSGLDRFLWKFTLVSRRVYFRKGKPPERGSGWCKSFFNVNRNGSAPVVVLDEQIGSGSGVKSDEAQI